MLLFVPHRLINLSKFFRTKSYTGVCSSHIKVDHVLHWRTVEPLKELEPLIFVPQSACNIVSQLITAIDSRNITLMSTRTKWRFRPGVIRQVYIRVKYTYLLNIKVSFFFLKSQINCCRRKSLRIKKNKNKKIYYDRYLLLI